MPVQNSPVRTKFNVMNWCRQGIEVVHGSSLEPISDDAGRA